MIATYVLSTILLCVISFLPSTRITHWIVRAFDFPRLQVVVLLLLSMVAFIFIAATQSVAFLSLPAGVFILSLVALALQLKWILPYTPLYPRQVASAGKQQPVKLSILNANVLMTNRNYPALLKLIREHSPDIVVTLESDQRWQDALTAIHSDYPYRIACPLDNLYGMHVYSKHALHKSEIKYLVEEDKPSIHCAISLDEQLVNLHFLHPAPPSPTENTTSGERDAELLVIAKALAKRTQGPTIVSGDLNDVAWSATTQAFLKISQLLDPRIGRGAFNTFHSDYWFARWPLDHIFHSRDFQLVRMLRLSHIGSDHFPLLTELALSSNHHANENDSHTDDTAEHHDLANDRIAKEDVAVSDVPNPRQALRS